MTNSKKHNKFITILILLFWLTATIIVVSVLGDLFHQTEDIITKSFIILGMLLQVLILMVMGAFVAYKRWL